MNRKLLPNWIEGKIIIYGGWTFSKYAAYILSARVTITKKETAVGVIGV